MSQFLPESIGKGSQIVDVPTGPDPMVERDRELARRLLKPINIPADFLAYIVDYLAVNIPQIPIGQVIGFEKYKGTTTTVIQATPILVEETTTSTTFTDLATGGPTLTALDKGQYVILYGALMKNSVGDLQAASIAPQVNAIAPTDPDDILSTRTTNRVGVAKGLYKNITTSANTIKMKYRTHSGSTGTFDDRWLIALRIGNPA